MNNYQDDIIKKKCDEKCKQIACNQFHSASDALDKCLTCPETDDYKCNKTTPEYKIIKTNYISNLEKYNKCLHNLELIPNMIDNKDSNKNNNKDVNKIDNKDFNKIDNKDVNKHDNNDKYLSEN
jgi:hypothetical protein